MAAVDNEFDEMAEGHLGGHREDGGPRRRRQHHRCRPQSHRHFLRRTARHDGFVRLLTPAARSLGIGQSYQPVCGLQIRSAPVPPDAQELLDGREDLRDPAAERFRAAGDLRAASRAPVPSNPEIVHLGGVDAALGRHRLHAAGIHRRPEPHGADTGHQACLHLRRLRPPERLPHLVLLIFPRFLGS